MKSRVFFVPVEDAEDIDAVNDKLDLLLAESRVLSVVEASRKVVVKLHFGEEGTNSFVRPDHLRLICDEIAQKGSVPFLSDANALANMDNSTQAGVHNENEVRDISGQY